MRTVLTVLADLPQLADRRKQLTKRQYVKMADTDNCLNYLLPVKRDSEIIGSLRTAKEYPLICAKSKLQKYVWPHHANEMINYSKTSTSILT